MINVSPTKDRNTWVLMVLVKPISVCVPLVLMSCPVTASQYEFKKRGLSAADFRTKFKGFVFDPGYAISELPKESINRRRRILD
jgi:hypothetical protein